MNAGKQRSAVRRNRSQRSADSLVRANHFPPLGNPRTKLSVLHCVLCLFAFLPLTGHTHEDLLLRVKGVTEQMSTNGTTAELLLLRAELYRAHQDWDLALKDYDAAAPSLTNSPALEFGRAQTLAGCGKLSKARAAFDNLLQRHPDNAAALLGRARVLAQLDHLALAIADYTRAFTNLTNPRPEDYLERARIQAAESGADAAVKGLDEGLARMGWTVTLQRAALDYDLERGNTDGALTRLESILTRSNRKESWLTLRAEILQKAGRTQDAREAFQAALKAIIDLPPRLATSENTVKLRARIEAALASIPSGAATNIAFPKATQ